MPEGEIFNTITNGKNTMLPYADKLAPDDRWAVVAYVRALQRAQQGTAADVTDAAERTNLASNELHAATAASLPARPAAPARARRSSSD